MSELKEAKVFSQPHEEEQDPELENFFDIFVNQLEHERAEKIDLGKGKTAHVWFTESPRFHERLCVKELHTEGPSVNGFEKEIELQHDAFVEGVQVPEPYFYIKTEDAEFIIMRIMEGRTIEQMREAGETLNDEQHATFRKSLEEQIDLMHKKTQIHHRDLHEGNVMVLPDGSAGIIDFGDAIWAGAVDEEDIYKARVVRNGRFEYRRMRQDRNMIDGLCGKIKAVEAVQS